MAARRCSVDSINVPTDAKYATCPVCSGQTNWLGDAEPDEDWNWKATLLLEQLVSASEPVPEIPRVPAGELEVKEDSGALWVHYWDAYHAGLKDKMSPGQLFQIGERVYEVEDWVDPLRSYIVRPFQTKATNEALHRLIEGE